MMLYNGWQCGGVRRRAAALKLGLCEILLSSKILQHIGHAAAAHDEIALEKWRQVHTEKLYSSLGFFMERAL